MKPLREAVRPTTFIESPRLSSLLGADTVIATETFQYTGSFKFRAAYNVALKVEPEHIITASSGNFGQAMAYACRILGKTCTAVMPTTSSRVKVEAVREYGGEVDLIDVNQISRADRVSQLAEERQEAYVASAYDDDLVIDGNASLGEELAATNRRFDTVIAPVGGGGLTSGIITGIRRTNGIIEIYGAEPQLANDASRSLREGHLVVNEQEPQTLADGARTVSLGNRNWEILSRRLAGIVEVPEEEIKAGVRHLFHLANLKAEPTGALAIGALLAEPQKFRGKSVCCVISGGNVDPALYRDLISG